MRTGFRPSLSLALGQQCPEGWTLYPVPGPQMKGVETPGSADFHYFSWVDQFNTLGLGENIPIANGSTSDALLTLMPNTGEWVVLRVPYPMAFYSRGLDGRIDDPDAGWKGRGPLLEPPPPFWAPGTAAGLSPWAARLFSQPRYAGTSHLPEATKKKRASLRRPIFISFPAASAGCAGRAPRHRSP